MIAMQRIRIYIVTTIAVLIGFLMLAHLFATETGVILGSTELAERLNNVGSVLLGTTQIVVTFALILGFVNVANVHIGRIRQKAPDFIYSIVLLVSFLLTLLVGLGGPTAAGSRFIFEFILQPLESTLFALLALFIASAAFRAFKIHNLETFIFVVFAWIVLLGQVPVLLYLGDQIPQIAEWVLTVPTLAGVRGIILGVALGTIATGLRILLGVERPYASE